MKTFMGEMVTQSQANQYRPIAGLLHLVFLIGLETANAILGKIRAEQMRHAMTVNRPQLYFRTIAVEWLVLAIVILGVRWHGSSVSAVFGDRWRSFRSVLRDFAIAIILLMLSIAVSTTLGHHHSKVSSDPAVQFLLPQGRIEMLLWAFVSLSAGICEEAVYRGYFQHQFIAFTASPPLGIVLAALGFGASHAYQGLRPAMLIGLTGAIFGMAAYYRKSVRPGMIAHASQDLLALLIRH